MSESDIRACAEIRVSLIWPGCAQGRYSVRAKGCLLAILFWARESEPLEGWGAIGYVALDPTGAGSVPFGGRRAIPVGATHVLARCLAHDLVTQTVASVPIPPRFLPDDRPHDNAVRLSIISDVHLSSKAGLVRQALSACAADTIMLVGDATNDGLEAQFGRLTRVEREVVPDKVVLPVPGNHDALHRAREGSEEGLRAYDDFQGRRLDHARDYGLEVSLAPDDRSWATRLGPVDVCGLACVTLMRRFHFERETLAWLKERLASSDASWHLVLCHAPLAAHNPVRSAPAFLHLDQELQDIIDNAGRVLFLSGHTHASPNTLCGNLDVDEEHCCVYLDCASVRPTDTSREGGLMAPDWKDGVVWELAVADDTVEILARSVWGGACLPRAHYRISLPADDNTVSF